MDVNGVGKTYGVYEINGNETKNQQNFKVDLSDPVDEISLSDKKEDASNEKKVSTGGKILRGVASGLVPGMGQFINGDVKKGALFIAGNAACYALAPLTGGLSLLGNLALNITSIVDAVKNAQ